MKDKIFSFLLIASGLFLSSCGNENQECVHSWDQGSVILEATCEEDGEMLYHCLNCEETKTEAIIKLGHNESEDYRYDEEGHYHYCTVCEKEMETQEHQFSDVEVIKEPSVLENGTMKIVCDICGYESEREIEKITHEKGNVYDYDETFHWFTCSKHDDCQVSFDMTPHNFEEVSRVESTCETKGSVTYKCSDCEYQKIEELELASHTYGEEYYNVSELGHCHKCEVCEENGEIEEHVMIDDVVLEEATGDKTGIMKTKCQYCDYTSTRIIEKLNHEQGQEIKYDETSHWIGCSSHQNCDMKYQEEEHNLVEIARVNPTCENEGSVTYKCNGCDYQKIEILEKLTHDYGSEYIYNETHHYHQCELCDGIDQEIAHEFDIVEIVTKPTLHSEGLQSTYCICGYKNPDDEVIPAQSNFRYDFSLESGTSSWSYGSVVYNWGESESFEFTPITTVNEDSYIGEGIEVKAGWINANNMMAIAYTASEDINVKAYIDFVGGVDSTRLSLRIGIKDNEGNLLANPEFNYNSESNIIDLEKEYQLLEGYTIYFIFGNEAGSNLEAFPNGTLDIKIVEHEIINTENDVANFRNDFTLESGTSSWSYGSVVYNWGESESFEFTPITTVNEDSYIGEGIEVKAGWINANNMMAIAYTASEDINVKAYIDFVGGVDSTRLSLRIGIKDNEGNLLANPEFNYNSESNIIDLEKEYQLLEGYTIYFIFGNEAGSNLEAFPNGALDIRFVEN